MSEEQQKLEPMTREEASNQTERLYAAAPCPLLVTLPTGEILRANDAFFDAIGLPRETPLGEIRFQTLLSTGSSLYYETHFAPLLRLQGAVNEIALELRGQDGVTYPVVASATQERDESGVAVLNHIALFSSAERRRYERQLLEARRQAEAASRMLQAADDRKNDFIATLAHELRNPLAPIRTAIELRRRRDEGDHIVDRTNEMMGRQVAQLSRLVEDLIDITRIAQNKLAIQRVSVDLSSVVHHAIEANEPLLRHAGLTLAPTFPTLPLYASVDASRLIQVISNILNNATKFTPRNGLVTLVLERSGEEAVIRIRDTGIGMDPEKLSRVFDMFMQADPSARPDGLGIGLTLAKTLVERHGGQIAAASDGAGLGTEFTIRLPALKEAPTSVSPSLREAEPARGAPRRVLVVDDNIDSAEVMVMLLQFDGHEVRTAYDGLDAVAQWESFRPDVVLLDIGLPKLDGYQVAQRIRARGGAQPLLVALTGWGQQSDRDRSQHSGFDVHLVKPVDHEALTALLSDLPR